MIIQKDDEYNYIQETNYITLDGGVWTKGPTGMHEDCQEDSNECWNWDS